MAMTPQGVQSSTGVPPAPIQKTALAHLLDPSTPSPLLSSLSLRLDSWYDSARCRQVLPEYRLGWYISLPSPASGSIASISSPLHFLLCLSTQRPGRHLAEPHFCAPSKFLPYVRDSSPPPTLLYVRSTSTFTTPLLRQLSFALFPFSPFRFLSGMRKSLPLHRRSETLGSFSISLFLHGLLEVLSFPFESGPTIVPLHRRAGSSAYVLSLATTPLLFLLSSFSSLPPLLSPLLSLFFSPSSSLTPLLSLLVSPSSSPSSCAASLVLQLHPYTGGLDPWHTC